MEHDDLSLQEEHDVTACLVNTSWKPCCVLSSYPLSLSMFPASWWAWFHSRGTKHAALSCPFWPHLDTGGALQCLDGLHLALMHPHFKHELTATIRKSAPCSVNHQVPQSRGGKHKHTNTTLAWDTAVKVLGHNKITAHVFLTPSKQSLQKVTCTTCWKVGDALGWEQGGTICQEIFQILSSYS